MRRATARTPTSETFTVADGAFTAKFGGHCFTCAAYIHPGHRVIMTEDGLIHEICP